MVSGEPLPRWALSLIWRKDGKPIWRNTALIASQPRAQAPTASDAQRFTERFATRLGIAPGHVMPAYEDPAERLLKEGALPPNIDPADPKIDDPVERARILRTFERQLSAPAGFVLPVQRWTAQAAAAGSPKSGNFAASRLFLVRATRQSACACRSVRCPLCRLKKSCCWWSRIPSPSASLWSIRRPRASACPIRSTCCAPSPAAATASRCGPPARARDATHTVPGAPRSRSSFARPALRVHAAGRTLEDYSSWSPR